MSELKPWQITVIAALVGFTLVYAPLYALGATPAPAGLGLGSATQGTTGTGTMPKSEEDNASSMNFRGAEDRISQVVPNLAFAPYIGPLAVVAVGLLTSLAAYVSVKKRMNA